MAATIAILTPIVTGEQPIVFQVAGGPGDPADHVALFPLGAPEQAPLPAQWCYLDGTQTPPVVGLTTAQLGLLPPAVGSYTVRLFSPNTAGTSVVAASAPARSQSLLSARLRIGRLGAFRLKYVPPPTSVGISIAGQDRTAHIRLGSLVIRDVINDAPNTCTFVLNRLPLPTPGAPIVITYPGMLTPLFAGAVERYEKAYEGGRPAQLVFRITCQDHTRLLQRTIVDRHFAEQSATAIATALVAGTGITPIAVAAGLPVVAGGIDFIGTPVRECLTTLMQRVGGYWYVDYSKGLHAFLTDATAPPDPLLPWPQTPSLMDDPPVTADEDLTQVRTRVYVTGAGSATLVPLAVGAVVIPVQDAGAFSPTGGTLITGTERLDYNGTVAGGVATNVGSAVATPSTAPTAALAATTVGKIVGVVRYRHTLKNASGETLPGPVSNAVTGVAFSPPTSGGGAPSAAAASGLGRLVGAYSWKYSYVTDRGETTPGPASSPPLTLTGAFPPAGVGISSAGAGPLVGTYGYRQTFLTAQGETSAGDLALRTAAAVGTPGAPTPSASSSVGPLIGTYGYRVSFVTALGETLAGAAGSVTLAAQGAPSAPTIDLSGGPGPLLGNYSYLVAFVSATGETIGAASGTATAPIVTANAPNVSGDGTGTSIAYAVTYRHPVFGESQLSARTVDTNKGTNPVVGITGLPAGCGAVVYSSGTSATAGTDPLYKIAELPIGVTSFTHTTQSGPQEGVIPTMGRYGTISGIPTGPPGTLARRIYRTKAGGSAYFLVGTISNNTGTTFTDVTPDGALQQGAINVADGRACDLTVATGPAGTLARRIYRTKAGGSAYYLVAQLSDNSTTTVQDTVPDSALAQGAPPTATAGGEAFTIALVSGPAGTIGRRLYRTAAGGATARLLVEVPDNSTSTVTDAVPDAAIAGAPVVPAVSTAGGQNATITGIAAGPTGTLARRLYRTKAGGAEWLLVAQLSDNSTTSYTDSTPDASLGRTAPLVNDAGASAVTVTVPVGPAGTTSRRVYRTEGGGAVYRFVTEIRDNTTPTVIDGKADSELGDLPPDVATIGALAGATSLTVIDASAFSDTGWARIDSQTITWTSRTNVTLFGIPATGVGALRSAVSAGSSLVALPLIVGVQGGLTLDLPQGAPVAVFVRRDDLAAQSALAAREGAGSTGIVEYAITHSRLSTREAQARADAELALFSRPIVRVRYVSRDLKTASGQSIAVNLPVLGLVGTFTIQAVTIDQIGIAQDRAAPRFTVEASTVRFSLEDAFRRLVAGMGGF